MYSCKRGLAYELHCNLESRIIRYKGYEANEIISRRSRMMIIYALRGIEDIKRDV